MPKFEYSEASVARFVDGPAIGVDAFYRPDDTVDERRHEHYLEARSIPVVERDTQAVVDHWRRLHRARGRATDVVYLTAPEAAELHRLIRGRNRTPLRLFHSYVVVVPEELLAR